MKKLTPDQQAMVKDTLRKQSYTHIDNPKKADKLIQLIINFQQNFRYTRSESREPYIFYFNGDRLVAFYNCNLLAGKLF